MSDYWFEPVDFQTGDVLGASQLNALLTDLDILSGLERRAECGYAFTGARPRALTVSRISINATPMP